MRAKGDDQGKSVRLLRVAEQVRHVLADLLARGELRDDVLASTMVSVTEVRVSPDLRNATAFVKPIAAKDEAAVLEALKANAKYLRGEVARRLNTRYTPDLSFRLDESFDEAGKIDKLLRSPKVRRDLST